MREMSEKGADAAATNATDMSDGWDIVRVDDPLPRDDDEGCWISVPTEPIRPSACRLAKEALDYVVEASQTQEPIDEERLQSMVSSIERRLDLTLGTDVRGQSSADTAFALSLVGIKNNSFALETLAKVARLELDRVSRRPSRRAKDVLHVIEKLAASGVRGEQVDRIYQLAAESLTMMQKHLDVVEILSSGKFDFLCPRPLLWLWRYTARLKKPAFV